MKIAKLFIIVAVLAVWPAACSLDTDDPPSKKTSVDEIVLRAYNYTTDTWTGGWESSWQDKDLLLSNLLPGGQIKNGTQYEVTITATLEFLAGNDKMEAFQFVFTKPGTGIIERWTDLVDDPYPEPKKGEDFILITADTADSFSITGTLTTKSDATENFATGVLALTNECDAKGAHGEDVAKFTNVVITITEK